MSSSNWIFPSSTSSSSQQHALLQREVFIANQERSCSGHKFPGNSIRTSKYTFISFLPRNLFEQFHRIAYIYFLLLIIVNQIPILAVFGRTISLVPLLSVLIVTAIKDGYEDLVRHRADRVENRRPCSILEKNFKPGSGGAFKQSTWRQLRVGDVVKLHCNEAVPCDMVLLACSDPTGRAFIETMNLDGETNLKTRSSVPLPHSWIAGHEHFGRRMATADGSEEWGESLIQALHNSLLICEIPNRNIYQFSGYLELASQSPVEDHPSLPTSSQAQVKVHDSFPGDDAPSPRSPSQTHRPGVSQSPRHMHSVPLGPSHVLLRGSELRNTSWAIGVCVYTGADTKAQLNSAGAQSKRSRIEAHMNRDMLVLCFVLMGLCLVGAIGTAVWLTQKNSELAFAGGVNALPYYGANYQYQGVVGEAAVDFFTSLILFQVMVPISLYISLEVVRLGQAFFMAADRHMQEPDEDEERKDELAGAEGREMEERGLDSNDWQEGKSEDSSPRLDATSPEHLIRGGNSTGSSSGGVAPGPSPKSRRKKRKRRGLIVRALNINEDLGQVSHVFSDKTGTLTENKMEFKSCCIDGQDYPNLQPAKGNALSGWQPHPGSLADSDLVSTLRSGQAHPSSSFSSHDLFLLTLALCNTVVPTQVTRTADGFMEMHAALSSSRESMERDAGGSGRENVGGPGVGGAADEGGGVSGGHAPAGGTVPNQMEAGHVEYQGESADEVALVKAAAAHGFALVERSEERAVLSVFGRLRMFAMLGVHEFDSDRKRMSVVVAETKEPSDSEYEGMGNEDGEDDVGVQSREGAGAGENRLLLLAKGADSTMLPLATGGEGRAGVGEGGGGGGGGGGDSGENRGETSPRQRIREQTERLLDAYSSQGLRTLVVAAKEMEEAEAEAWREGYEAAGRAILDRAVQMAQVAEAAEEGMQLLGATGIEDKLQEGVGDSLRLLRESGCRVWMLTGDKAETAASIALSSQLLTPQMRRVELKGESKREVYVELQKAVKEVAAVVEAEQQPHAAKPEGVSTAALGVGASPAVPGEGPQAEGNSGGDQEKPAASWRHRVLASLHPSRLLSLFLSLLHPPALRVEPPPSQLALIIDGHTLSIALADDFEQEFFSLAMRCSAVLCCRVAPLQKAAVVRLVKKFSQSLTLAVGDGANDVSMLQAAHIGVGISGREGTQAVMASDFAIPSFRFLPRLLLVHGHWNYSRIAYMVLYNLYRNAVFVMLLFWYILYTAFSSFSAIGQLSLVLFSLLYTSLPTVVLGILDKDLSPETLLASPALYDVGRQEVMYNARRFWVTMLDTLWQSLVLFFVAFFAVGGLGATDLGVWSVGQIWTVGVVLVVTVHLCMDIWDWSWPVHAVIWGSVTATFLCVLAIDYVQAFPEFGSFRHSVITSVYWLSILLTLPLSLLPRFVVKHLWNHFWPSDIQIAFEAETLQNSRQHQPRDGAT